MLVHTYSAIMAVRLVAGHRLGAAGRRLVRRDNVPVSAAVVVPAVAFVLAAAEVVSLETAFRVSIAFCVLALTVTGLLEARASGVGWPRSVLSAATAGGIGLLLVLVEAAFQ